MKEPCIEQASGKYDWIIPGVTYLLKTLYKNYSQTYDIRSTLVYNNLVDHLIRCSWSACRRWSNCIYILDLTPDFNGI